MSGLKDAGQEELVASMRAILCYAERAVNKDGAKLSLIGWGKAVSSVLQAPGQSRTLEAPRQSEGWVFLDWEKPADGGEVAAYRIERRERPNWRLDSH